MMHFVYNTLIKLVKLILPLLGTFNLKLKKGILGRTNCFKKLKAHVNENDKTIWLHCASLGEYEQGLPVFEKLRDLYPKHKIILSFFSPSGYEIRKNTAIADVVVYLPLDTKANAKTFIELLKPELSVFIKYDIWPNYLSELKQHNLKTILISAAFRPNQIYFKWYGGLFRDALKSFNHIFTQNEISKQLLSQISYHNVTVSGDTRFDRVTNQLKLNNKLDFIEEFKANKPLVVIGSSWETDETLYLNYVNNNKHDVKFVIAPHEIKPEKIDKLQNNLTRKVVLYSKKDNHNLEDFDVFILDTIGILSKTYAYADIAYVGGAAGNTGLHNILEPATFGVPILFGKNHKKFPEAQNLINYGGAFSVENQNAFFETLDKLLLNKNRRKECGKNSSNFIENQTGATLKVMNWLKQ